MSEQEPIQQEASYFGFIPDHVLSDESLTDAAVLFYALIATHVKKAGYAFGSTGYYASVARGKPDVRTVNRWIEQLEENGHIVVEYAGKQRRIFLALNGVKTSGHKCPGSYKNRDKNVPEPGQICPGDKNVPYINESTISTIKEDYRKREGEPEHTPSALPPRNTGNAANAYIPTLDECKDYATNPACGFPPTLVEEWYDRQCDRGWGNDWRARMRASSATYRTIYAERKTFKRKTDYDVNAKPADQKKQPPKSSWQLQEEQWQREKEEMLERAQQRRQANGAQHHTHT